MTTNLLRATASWAARGAISAATRLTSVRRFNGARMVLPSAAARHIMPFTDIEYETDEWRTLQVCGRPGQSFLDIGANIGVLTVAMSRIAGRYGRVLAAEPQPAVSRILEDVLRLNKCDNASVVRAAVASNSGALRFFVSQATALGVSSSVHNNDATGTEILVPAVTIDDLYSGAHGVDYIKIDAEGAEADILVGASHVLARCRPVAQVEVHGQYLGDAREAIIASMFTQMRELDYACINLPLRKEVSAEEFIENTHYNVVDPGTGLNLSTMGYGQIAFVPSERTDVCVALCA